MSLVVDLGGELPPGRNHFLIRTRVDAGEYFVRVLPLESEGTSVYTLYVDRVAEPGNTRATAVSLSFDDAEGGRIDPGSDVDYFRLDVAEARYVALAVAGEGVTIKGELLDNNGSAVDANIYSYTATSPDPDRKVVFLSDRLDAGTYFLKVTSSNEETGPYTVLASEDAAYRYFYNRCSRIVTSYDDPLYGCQWHLKNTGQLGGTSGEDINVEGAWATVLGTGIAVAVVDGGLDLSHEDLAENVDTSKGHDYDGASRIFSFGRAHGIGVAGVIAARDNSVGVRGVAPRATIYSFSYDSSLGDANSVDAMTRQMATTAVSNNSWGQSGGVGLKHMPATWDMALDLGVTTGYDGKGVVYVFAAGNFGSFGDNANYDELANYYAVVAVCCVNDRGRHPQYSVKGASLWVCAPSDDDFEGQFITTTDDANRYHDGFGGTSAAAPMVSGVVALVREANTALTWRDVKLILAASARQADASAPSWATGAHRYRSSSESYNFSHEYGFGVVDATAAVKLANDWTNLPALVKETSASTGSSVEVPDTDTTVTWTISVDSDLEFIEFVQIDTDFDAEAFRDLQVELVSPSGAVSVLAEPLEFSDPGLGVDESYRFGSARHLGERPAGTWTLRMTD